jgi:Mg2+-importing ATPase
MLVLGPVSSLFDFLTFAMFQTGWFIESLAIQCLVIFVIRTRGVPWWLTLGAVFVGLLIPLTLLGRLLGFVEPPAGFYLFLVCAVAAYLRLVEIGSGSSIASWTVGPNQRGLALMNIDAGRRANRHEPA